MTEYSRCSYKEKKHIQTLKTEPLRNLSPENKVPTLDYFLGNYNKITLGLMFLFLKFKVPSFETPVAKHSKINSSVLTFDWL